MDVLFRGFQKNEVSVAKKGPYTPSGSIIVCADDLGLPLIELSIEISIACEAKLIVDGDIGLIVDLLAGDGGG